MNFEKMDESRIAEMVRNHGGDSCVVAEGFVPGMGNVRIFTDMAARDSYSDHVSRPNEKGEFTHNGTVVAWATF